MQSPPSRIRVTFRISILLSVLSAGCASTTVHEGDTQYVSIARYNIHMTNYELEALHRVQINDIAGLQANLEGMLASSVVMLWSSIKNEQTSDEDRKSAYSTLRLMAVQNENFPVAQWNDQFQLAEIFEAAIQEDPESADRLRRQNWSKPKWVEWVE